MASIFVACRRSTIQFTTCGLVPSLRASWEAVTTTEAFRSAAPGTLSTHTITHSKGVV